MSHRAIAAEIVEEVARGQAARMYRGGAWDDLTESDKNGVRALVRPIIADALKAAARISVRRETPR